MRSAIVGLVRWTGTTLLFLTVLICLSLVLVPPFLDRIYYRGPASDHFDGQRFFNPDGEDAAQVPGGVNRWRFIARRIVGDATTRRADWPAQVPVTPTRPAARVDGDRMVATWVGHATVLVQTQGLNILTDPVWSETAGPLGVGPRRVAAPGVRLEDLPKIDLIVVSHNHYDHMDLRTLKRLWDRDRPLIVTSLGNDTLIRGAGAQAKGADWGGRVTLKPGVEVFVTRNHHWGSRWFSDRNRALWSSFTVKLPGGNVFFAGDTGFGDGEWPREAARHGPVRLAILPIGAFRFAPGMMSTSSHIGPIEAAEVFARSGASRGVAIHWGTFRLSDEAYDTPPRMLAEAMKCRGWPAQGLFDAVPIGRPVEIAASTPQPQGQAPAKGCLTAPAITSLP